jgi:hypothetical protein
LPILDPHLDKKSSDEGFLAGSHDADRGKRSGVIATFPLLNQATQPQAQSRLLKRDHAGSFECVFW